MNLLMKQYSALLVAINQSLNLPGLFKVKKVLHHINFLSEFFTTGSFQNRHYHLTVNTHLLQQFYLPR